MERSARFLTKILRLGCTVTAQSNNEFIIKERDFFKLKAIINEFGAHVSESMGLFGIIKRQKRRYGLLSAMILILLACPLSSDTVWDIRVSGNENIKAETVLDELDALSFSVGNRWSKSDINDIESKILLTSNNISWININRRGSVAYVEIIEKKVYETEENIEYSNIVATQDCIIEQINVKSGYAAVKVGDTVKKGEILIVGIQGEGGDFCRAEGTVKGRKWEEISVSVDREEDEKVYEAPVISGFAVKIFKFQINILKNYGNSTGKYDIISSIKTCKLINGVALPITFISEFEKPYTVACKNLTDEELVSRARSDMALRISELSKSAELVKINTVGSFVSSGYQMISSVTLITDVADEVPFSVN